MYALLVAQLLWRKSPQELGVLLAVPRPFLEKALQSADVPGLLLVARPRLWRRHMMMLLGYRRGGREIDNANNYVGACFGDVAPMEYVVF